MFKGLSATPTCIPPFYETTAGSGVFTDTVGGTGRICNPCEQGERWSSAGQVCVLDTSPSPSDNPPMGDTVKYLIMGIGALLLVGAFMGGRASKKSSSILRSRTTTRSVFG